MAPTTWSWRFAVTTTLGVWLFLVATTPGIPLVWDEAEYLYRAEEVSQWFQRVANSSSLRDTIESFSEATIRRQWLFTIYSEGHPAWFSIPIILSRAAFSDLLSPLIAARIGPITIFSLACGFVAIRLKKDYGSLAAIVGPVALVTFQRIFSHAHFATLDGQLTAWWLILWAVGSSLSSSNRASIVIGIIAGLTSATKFTGWLSWVPLVLFHILKQNPVKWRWIAMTVAVGLLTFCLVNPPMWHSPIDGLVTHFQLNLTRTASNNNIPTFFLGQCYDLLSTLPWHNTLTWLLITTPLPTLVLGFIGFFYCLRTACISKVTSEAARSTQAVSTALLLHWATLMILRALPGAPPHDGIRLFLPSFGLWCLLAGIGAQRTWDMVIPLTLWRKRIAHCIIWAALIGAGVNLARYYPQNLSHYNLLVGGVRGASQLGMEPTYWWDALDNDALSWLNTNTTPGSAVAFSRLSANNLSRLQEWGHLQVDTTNPDEENFQWYVMQNRQSLFDAVERTLFNSTKPVYVSYAGHLGENVDQDLQVPLLMVFSADQYNEALLDSRTDQQGVGCR